MMLVAAQGVDFAMRWWCLKNYAKPARIAGCSNLVSGNAAQADHFIEIANPVDKGAWQETAGN